MTTRVFEVLVTAVGALALFASFLIRWILKNYKHQIEINNKISNALTAIHSNIDKQTSINDKLSNTLDSVDRRIQSHEDETIKFNKSCVSALRRIARSQECNQNGKNRG